MARWIEESVENLSSRNLEISMDRELSRCYQEGRVHKNFARWIKNLSRLLSRKEKEGLDRKEFVEKLSSLKKKEVFKGEKHIKMNATSKLLNQRSNQHVKLSKHLSTYKKSIHRSKTHTHTRVLNKSNQFYISKIS